MLHGDHLVNHIQSPELRNENTLHVIGVISNPVRYHSRYRLAREWIHEMAKTPHVKLTLVECAFGDRQHELMELCQDLKIDYVPLRTRSEIWIKENMINIGYKHITVRHPGAKYFAHVDCDVHFSHHGWAQEALHQLQHFAVIQPWSDCMDLGPSGEVLQHFRSFGSQHQKRIRKQMHPSQPYQYAHSGYAWCWRREFWERVQGLMDYAILGSADHHMAFAMVGEVKNTIHKGMSKGFFERCFEWQDSAMEITKKEVGFCKGTITHSFHGPKNRRYYRERWQILIDHKYDPKKDIMYDSAGVIRLKGKPDLEQAIRLYNRSRHEDSIETY